MSCKIIRISETDFNEPFSNNYYNSNNQLDYVTVVIITNQIRRGT